MASSTSLHTSPRLILTSFPGPERETDRVWKEKVKTGRLSNALHRLLACIIYGLVTVIKNSYLFGRVVGVGGRERRKIEGDSTRTHKHTSL